MGILTDFFIASDEELKDIFNSWLPVAMEKNKEYRNPFTGEIQLDWGPDPLAFEKWESAQKQLENNTHKKVSKQSEHRGLLGRLFRKENVSTQPGDRTNTGK